MAGNHDLRRLPRAVPARSRFQLSKPVMNVFGEFVDPEEYAPPPCRSIPITPEILAEEAAKQAAREVPVEVWPLKATLDAANLHGMKKRERTGSKEDRPGRRCACGERIAPKTKSDLCTNCRTAARLAKANEPRQPKRSITERKPHMATQYCAGGCGTELTAKQISNGITIAWGHKNGCHSEKTSTAPKNKGAKSSPPPQIGLEHTIAFARNTRDQLNAIIEGLHTQRAEIDARIEREEQHLGFLTLLLEGFHDANAAEDKGGQEEPFDEQIHAAQAM